MSGYVGDLSPSQEQTLKQFRENLGDALKPQHDDHLLLQFLRARRFDLKKTEEMFRRHLKFREEFPEEYFLNEYKPHENERAQKKNGTAEIRVDHAKPTLLALLQITPDSKEKFEILLKHLLPPLIGYDKDGCPIRIIHIGHQDIKGILASVRRPEIRKCITWFLDTDKQEMRRRNEETGKYVEKRTFIFDLADLSLRQIYHRDVYELMISFLKLYEGNYPENLKVAFIINTPPFFSWLFTMVKSIISEDTVKKLRIHGHSGWKQDLLTYIDAELLPVIYGGTRTSPDGNPRCPEIVREFFLIPKEHYLRNQNHIDPSEEGVQKVSVGRRSKHSCGPWRVEAGSRIEWEVECLHNDIRASLLFCEGNKASLPVANIKNISNATFGVERGSYVAHKTGQYTLVLDNSYSILRSKNVLYRVSIIEMTPIDSDLVHELNEDYLRGE